MAEEPLREIIDAMRTRIQAELDAQIQTLGARHDDEVARARQDAEAAAEQRWGSRVEAVTSEWSARLESEVSAARAEAEKRWGSRVEAVMSEWTARLESEVSAARAEADKRLAAEAARVRTEAEQRLTSESMHVKSEAEQALAAERQRAAAELDAERRRAEEELQQTLAALDAERQQLEEEARSTRVDTTSLLGATRDISDARSLSETLNSLVRGAAAHAPRVAVFIVNGTHLDEWSVAGVLPMSHQPIDVDQGRLLRAALTRGASVAAIDGDAERTAPAFASLPQGRSAVAVPLMVGGQAVAVLYADEGVAGTEQGNHGWAETVELLARHAAACLAHVTAVRSLQLLKGQEAAHPEPAAADEDLSARRYAKLLVSEIKLYNEGAVRAGREKRDLSQRLKAEIDRARRLYEERVSPSVQARTSYFHEELIHTLAGGDPGVLGS